MLKRVVIGLLAVLGLVGVTSAQQNISPALNEHIEEIETYTIETRELEELKPVERIFPTRQEAIDYVLNIYEEEIPEEEAFRLALLYEAFDLLPPDSDYLDTYLDLLSAQIGGFYDPVTEGMYTLLLTGDKLGDELPLFERIVYAHEFTHALQDQHFDLEAVQASAGDNRDKLQAVISLIEGDATVLMNLYTQAISEADPFGTALQLLAQGIETNTLMLPPGTPPVIASELLSAYMDGSVFVTALYQDGGWEAVNAAYTNLPRSTEQILHPEKYIAGETPFDVTLGSINLPDGWTTIWDNTMGEFYLREYLKTQLTSAEANKAAAGWGGDRYQVFYNETDDELAWVMRLEWDSVEDAAEFKELYSDFATARFGGATPDSAMCWSEAAEALCVLPEADVYTITYAPTRDMALMLLDTQE